MSNEPTEPRSNWTLRLIAPKFNDELYLWMSTIPVVCGLIQFIVSFGYFLRFIGAICSGASGGGGVVALVAVIFLFLGLICIVVAFVSGCFYGISSAAMLFEQAPWLIYLWLAIVVMGSLFKNTKKVKTIGDNESEYALTNIYFWGMGATAIIVSIIANDVFTKGLVETGDGNWLFIPFGLLSCFIAIFQFFIKPAITSLIVLYIFFFSRVSDEREGIIKQVHNVLKKHDSTHRAESIVAENQVDVNVLKKTRHQTSQTNRKPRSKFSVLGYLVIASTIILFGAFLFPEKTKYLASYISPLVSTSGFDSLNTVKKETSHNGENSKTTAFSNNKKLPKIPKQNWNKVFMIPGPNFSFDKLNIRLPYQQLINAARSGDKEAKIQVAILYMHGVRVKHDFQKAEYWFNKSAQDKHPQGQKMLAFTYFGTKDKSQNHLAFKYFRAAALQGDLEAQYWTSRLYQNGDGVSRDIEKADYWNNKAMMQEMGWGE